MGSKYLDKGYRLIVNVKAYTTARLQSIILMTLYQLKHIEAFLTSFLLLWETEWIITSASVITSSRVADNLVF